jgi:excisionase family DNA binding protein
VSDQLLKARDAGRLLGLSARTMYALAAAGKIACHRMGVGDAAIRFDPADIEAYKTACRSPATTPAAGCSSLIASSPEPAGNALTAYFRKAGREPKRKPTTSGKQRGSTSLQLVVIGPSR